MVLEVIGTKLSTKRVKGEGSEKRKTFKQKE